MLGTEELHQYLDKYGLELPKVYNGVLKEYPQVPWSSFINDKNREKCTPEALDLLSRLLQYDHQVGAFQFVHRVAPSHCKGGNGASLLR